jgi:hypothetical protein
MKNTTDAVLSIDNVFIHLSPIVRSSARCVAFCFVVFLPVLRVQIRRIHMFLGLPDPDPLIRDTVPDPIVRDTDPDQDQDPSIIKQK